jgi:pimeloyl-ACP methyl ester carboxylesterase
MIRLRVASIALALLVGATVAMGASGVLSPPDTKLHCQQTAVPVTLTPTDVTSYHVVGWLCARGPAQGKTVELLVSGLTYDHNYWDLPYQPDTYSYVRSVTSFGYATFNIDRIGVGSSDRPPGDAVTMVSEGYVTHQIVQALRRGQVGNTPFAKVIGVGHSMGGGIWIYEASTYADVDGVIVADYLHQVNPAQQAVIGATMYPAQGDPRFAGRALPPGYVTTQPGTRGASFFNRGSADPAMLSRDEAMKQTATTGERVTLNFARDVRFSQQIRVPTLLVVGEHDLLACTVGMSCANSAAILAREQADFSPQACLEAVVLAGAGHDTNLHPNALQWYVAAAGWATRRVGAGQQTRPTQQCGTQT